ncbi:MAG: glutamate--tRNA ligase family protein, partial [Planctomycetota bacterium]|nr:glutamate--tRNA ligase family protein [Planctomycetota bacterium]
LSKRTGDTALQDYINSGHPADALFNFLCLLGFAIDDKTTVFSRSELLQHFALKKISKAGAIFDTEKLNWICGEYIRNTSIESLASAADPFFKTAGHNLSAEVLEKIISALQPRVNLYSQFAEQAAPLLGEVSYSDKAAKELAKDGVGEIIQAVTKAIEDEHWPPKDFFATVKAVAAEKDLGLGKVMKPIRCALTGQLGGPELADVLVILGREQSLSRLAKAVELV